MGIIFGLLTSNFYLGTTHNAIEDRKIETRAEEDTTDEEVLRRVREAEEAARQEIGPRA